MYLVVVKKKKKKNIQVMKMLLFHLHFMATFIIEWNLLKSKQRRGRMNSERSSFYPLAFHHKPNFQVITRPRRNLTGLGSGAECHGYAIRSIRNEIINSTLFPLITP